MVHGALIMWVEDDVAVAMVKGIDGTSAVVSTERLATFEGM
jgi:hypothetical protein